MLCYEVGEAARDAELQELVVPVRVVRAIVLPAVPVRLVFVVPVRVVRAIVLPAVPVRLLSYLHTVLKRNRERTH